MKGTARRYELPAAGIVAIPAGIVLACCLSSCSGTMGGKAIAAAPSAQMGEGSAPAAAEASTIAFSRCHYVMTPAFEPQIRLECPPGEVVVAVYAQSVRCCALEMH
jgi:hypothetical protein